MNFNIKINGQDYQFDKDYTILQACEIAGVEIPRFCYHEKLEIAGNCRMCLVTVKGAPKPVASCATNIANNMEVITNNEATKKARENVMELLLINHPLDCPVCDQGGECDLQDQAMTYGKGSSEYHEEKRIVKEKDLGPFIKTAMTRCILCMRCVRFMDSIAGVHALDSMNRGENAEIVNAISGAIDSELSGNIIDLCPVGALTNKPYSFKARPWELRHTNSIDIMDSLCSNIRIDSRGKETLRILPRRNDSINEEWLSDKSRFSYDGLTYNRLMKPYMKINGKLNYAPWVECFNIIKEKIFSSNPKKIAIHTGKFADCEAIFSIKKLCEKLNITSLYSNSIAKYLPKSKKAIFNSKISGIDDADLFLIVGCNIRTISPVLNSRIRQNIANRGTPAYLIGGKYDLTYPYNHLGNDISTLNQIIQNDHPICEKLKEAKKPMIIIGQEIFEYSEELANYVLESTNELIKKYNFIDENWNGVNILHNHTGSINGLMIDFYNTGKNYEELDLLILFGEDDMEIPRSNFIIYIGHHGDKGAKHADLILPTLAYTEKSATYINCEGRTQTTNQAIEFPGDAKEDWVIIKELAKHLNINLEFENVDDIRKHLSSEFNVKSGKFCNDSKENINYKEKNFFDIEAQIDKNFSFALPDKPYNFYDTDVISKNSKNMQLAIEMKKRVDNLV